MSIISENVIPGTHGKVFETNAIELTELELVKSSILKIQGIESVSVNSNTFPAELTVCSSKLVTIKAIEDAVIKVGFHVILKSVLPL